MPTMFDDVPWTISGHNVCIPVGVTTFSNDAVDNAATTRCFSHPLLTEFVIQSPESDFHGTLYDVLNNRNTTPFFDGMRHVFCRWEEDDDTMYPAFAHYENNLTDTEDPLVYVTYREDDEESHWVPTDWCWTKPHQDVYTAGSFLYTLWDRDESTEVSVFHRAFSMISKEFPDAPPTVFSYHEGVEYYKASPNHELETHEKTIPTHLELYLETQTPTPRTFHPFPQSLTKQVDNKVLLYEKYREDPKVAASFPQTFSSIRKALEETKDEPDRLFFVKESEGTRGEGIRVLRRSELENEEEPEDGDAVIQPALDAILTVNKCPPSQDSHGKDACVGELHGRRFDIRFYVVVRGGTAYVHSNMFAKWSYSPKPFDPQDPTIENQVPFLSEQDSVRDDLLFPAPDKTWRTKEKQKETSVNEHSGHVDPISWRNAVAAALDNAKPALENLITATASDPSRYHLLGGDAVMQQTGKAVLIEFNDWPDIYYYHKIYKCREDEEVCLKKRLVLLSASEPKGYTVTPPSQMVLYATAGYIAQMLRDMISLVTGLDQPQDLERFREIGCVADVCLS